VTARGSSVGGLLAWALILLALAFFFAPLVPPVAQSFANIEPGQRVLAHYAAVLSDPALVAAAQNSVLVALPVAIASPVLALLSAQAVRAWRIPRLIIGVVLLPLFIPGVSMGVATALFFREVGVEPSLFTMICVQVLWALPFAFLIILTAMASFDPIYLEAAHMSGAGPLQAFFDIELPQIRQGLLGAAIFSLIISLNETIRTSLVEGGRNTLPTYLWAQYQQVGLSPELDALMSMLILGTLALIVVLAVAEGRRSATAAKRDSQK
jgi:spermidine/putrescine transport system permease protein